MMEIVDHVYCAIEKIAAAKIVKIIDEHIPGTHDRNRGKAKEIFIFFL